MSLFVCAKCGCVDNTATSSYWMLTNEYMVDKFEYAKELQPYKGMGLCSECGRLTTAPDGRDVVVIGKTILYLRCFLTQVQIQIIL